MDARSGGKMVTKRQRRLVPGPYDRPPPPPPPPEKSPNWLTGHVFPATRTILSGASKILSSVFNPDSSSSESSEPESESDSMSEDEARDENDTLFEVDELNEDPQLSGGRNRTKHLVEQLLMQETFSRKERDKLVAIINSRVVDSSSAEEEFGLHSAIPDQTVADDTLDLSSQAIVEARKWLEEKRDGQGGLYSVVKNVEDTFGSPVDMAKSYMKVRPPWASPATDHIGLRTPSLMKAKLFDDGSPYSVSGDSLSSLKKRNSFASGSWNIQEEIRKVRTKATEDLLRSLPSTKTDYQLHVVDCKAVTKPAVDDLMGTTRNADKISDSSSLRLAKLSDVPIKWSDVEITEEGGENVTLLNPASTIQRQDQSTEAVQVGEVAACESLCLNGPILPSEHCDGLHTTGSDAQVVTQPNIAQSSNGHPSSEARGQNYVNGSGEKPKPRTSSQDKLTESILVVENKSIQIEDNCEFLSERSVDVPDVKETTGSLGASTMPGEELSQDDACSGRDLTVNADDGKVVKQGKRPRKSVKGRGKR